MGVPIWFLSGVSIDGARSFQRLHYFLALLSLALSLSVSLCSFLYEKRRLWSGDRETEGGGGEISSRRKKRESEGR